MNVCVNEFVDVLRKATLNFSIESIRLIFTKETIKSKMISQGNDAVAIMNIPNTVIPDMRNEVEFYFSEPAVFLVPFLSLIDTPNVATEIEISSEKIKLITGNQISNIFFCSPQIVSVLSRDDVKSDVKFFHEADVDAQLFNNFNKIKKIGARFGKIYWVVENGKLFIETTDRQNPFSNGMRFEVGAVTGPDISLCFDYRNFTNAMSVIEGVEGFKMSLSYIKEQDLGMTAFRRSSGTNFEKYYLMSRRDI